MSDDEDDTKREEVKKLLTEAIPSIDDLDEAFPYELSDEELDMAQRIFYKTRDVFLAWYDLKILNEEAANAFLKASDTLAMNNPLLKEKMNKESDDDNMIYR